MRTKSFVLAYVFLAGANFCAALKAAIEGRSWGVFVSLTLSFVLCLIANFSVEGGSK